VTPAYRDPDGRIAQVWTQETRTPDGTRVVLRFAWVDGRAECVALEVGADLDDPDEPEPKPLTTTNLRGIRLPKLVEQAARVYRETVIEAVKARGFLNTDAPTATDERALAALREWGRAERSVAEAPPRSRRGGRPPRGPEHLREVAEAYAAAYKAGDRPTKAVADKWTVSRPTAAKWVAQARSVGLLGPTERRRAGGVPEQEPPQAPARRRKGQRPTK
jgi:hypothetical protein